MPERVDLELVVKGLSEEDLGKIGAAIAVLDEVRVASEALTEAVAAAASALKLANEAMRQLQPPGLMQRISDYVIGGLRRAWPGSDGA